MEILHSYWYTGLTEPSLPQWKYCIRTGIRVLTEPSLPQWKYCIRIGIRALTKPSLPRRKNNLSKFSQISVVVKGIGKEV